MNRKPIKKRKNEILGTRLNGSFTVEAAFIIPIIVYLIVALIYLSFYLHDKTKAQAIISKTWIQSIVLVRNNQASIPIKSYSKEESEIEQSLHTKLKKQLFILKANAISARLSEKKSEITISFTISLPYSFLRYLILKRGNGIVLQIKGKVPQEEEWVRKEGKLI